MVDRVINAIDLFVLFVAMPALLLVARLIDHLIGRYP